MVKPGYTGQVVPEGMEQALATPAPGEQVVDVAPVSAVAEAVDTPLEAVNPPLPAVTAPDPPRPTLGSNLPSGMQPHSLAGVNQDPAYLMTLLPTKKTVVKTDFSGSILMVYGPPKIGKSELASQFPTPLFLATEKGHDHLQIYKQDVAIWPQFLEIVQALITYGAAQELPYQTIVIDTVDNLFDFCLHAYCAEKGIRHPSDEDFGKGWDGLRLEWLKGISSLVNLGFTVIFISHSKVRKVTMHSIERDVVQPSLSNTARRVVMPSVDYIVCLEHCSKDISMDGRQMVLRGDETIEAGDRSGFFTPTIPTISYDALHHDYVTNVVPGLEAKYDVIQSTKEVASE